MHVDRLGRGELIAAMGSILLVVCVFLPWYETAADNPNAVIDGARGALSAWEVHPVVRWLLLAAAAAPLILVWIVIRDHELSWPRGEMTAVAAIAAFGLTAYVGVLDRPGTPSGAISLQPGFYGALLGTLLMIAGGAMSAGQTQRTRKPPGVL
ncbi:MAG TPA: hypothetical protein VHJ39_18325 [Solirubrobacteraceae bacterium]|jgi:hypothetical protein|nr:hypothetical protein [Solirubrobacteraceae bacterium]